MRVLISRPSQKVFFCKLNWPRFKSNLFAIYHLPHWYWLCALGRLKLGWWWFERRTGKSGRASLWGSLCWGSRAWSAPCICCPLQKGEGVVRFGRKKSFEVVVFVEEPTWTRFPSYIPTIRLETTVVLWRARGSPQVLWCTWRSGTEIRLFSQSLKKREAK